MKRYVIFLLIPAALLFACSDEEPQPLTPDLVTEVKAYDLGNSGDASDIRVDFNVENNLNVIEYRVMILPAALSGSFDINVAESIPEGSFVRWIPESFETEYSVNRLPSTTLAVNGSPAANDIEYVVAILVMGRSGFQLSGFSRVFTLQDQGIYSGTYGMSVFLDVHGIFYDSVSLTFTAGEYRGTIIGHIESSNNRWDPCPEGKNQTNFGDISLSVSEDAIANFELVETRPDFCIPQKITQTGSGVIFDELVMYMPLSLSYPPELNLRRL